MERAARRARRLRVGLRDRPRGRPPRAEPARHRATRSAGSSARTRTRPTRCPCGSSCRPTATRASGRTRSFDQLEPGDVEEAITASEAVGDDRLQRRARAASVRPGLVHARDLRRSGREWFQARAARSRRRRRATCDDGSVRRTRTARLSALRASARLEQRLDQAVGRVRVGLEVRLGAVLAQRGAGGRADRGQPRAARALRPAALREEAHRRGRGEQQVVGAGGGRARCRRRAARRPSRRARARRPRRRARAARRGARRGPRRRGRSARGVTGTSRSASTSPSATARSGTTSGSTPRSRRARAVPGPDRGDGDPGQLARVAQQRQQPLGAVGRGDARRGRSGSGRAWRPAAARSGSPAPRRPSAPSSRSRARERARLRPRARDGDRAAVQRAALEPGELLAQRGDRPDERDRRRADALLRGPLGDVGERGEQRALAGQRAALDHRDGLVRRRGRRRSAARRSAAARARPCRRRACPGKAASAGQSSADSGLAGSSWPVTNATPLASSRWVTGMPGVGGRGDAGGDAGHDLERDAGLAQHAAPPRRRGRTRTGRRP